MYAVMSCCSCGITEARCSNCVMPDWKTDANGPVSIGLIIFALQTLGRDWIGGVAQCTKSVVDDDPVVLATWQIAGKAALRDCNITSQVQKCKVALQEHRNAFLARLNSCRAASPAFCLIAKATGLIVRYTHATNVQRHKLRTSCCDRF